MTISVLIKNDGQGNTEIIEVGQLDKSGKKYPQSTLKPGQEIQVHVWEGSGVYVDELMVSCAA
jgi:hypothetical protein